MSCARARSKRRALALSRLRLTPRRPPAIRKTARAHVRTRVICVRDARSSNCQTTDRPAGSLRSRWQQAAHVFAHLHTLTRRRRRRRRHRHYRQLRALSYTPPPPPPRSPKSLPPVAGAAAAVGVVTTFESFLSLRRAPPPLPPPLVLPLVPPTLP